MHYPLCMYVYMYVHVVCNGAHEYVPNCLASCNFKLLKLVSSAWTSLAVSVPLRYCKGEKAGSCTIDMQHFEVVTSILASNCNHKKMV